MKINVYRNQTIIIMKIASYTVGYYMNYIIYPISDLSNTSSSTVSTLRIPPCLRPGIRNRQENLPIPPSLGTTWKWTHTMFFQATKQMLPHFILFKNTASWVFSMAKVIA